MNIKLVTPTEELLNKFQINQNHLDLIMENNDDDLYLILYNDIYVGIIGTLRLFEITDDYGKSWSYENLFFIDILPKYQRQNIGTTSCRILLEIKKSFNMTFHKDNQEATNAMNKFLQQIVSVGINQGISVDRKVYDDRYHYAISLYSP